MTLHAFTIELTPQDSIEASALLAARHRLRRLGPVLVVVVSLGVGALIALATTRLGNPGEVRRAFGLSTALCALFLGLQYLLLLRIAVQTTRRSIESAGWVGRQVAGRISQAGLSFGEGEVTLAWNDVRACVEGASLFVITSATQPPLVLPRRNLLLEAQSLLRTTQVRA